MQELQDRTLLQTQRLHHRQYPLPKAAPFRTVAAKCVLTPQHAGSQQTLDVVVGRLDPLLIQKRPQGWLRRQQVATQRRRFGIPAARTLSQPTPHHVAERFQRALQGRTAPAAAKKVPFGKQNVDRRQAQCAVFRGFPAPIHQLRKVPLPVRPAPLPQTEFHLTIDRPAVAGDEALDLLAPQSGQTHDAAAESDDKTSHHGRGRAPQPTLVARLIPARLIDVLGGSLLHRLLGLGVGGRINSLTCCSSRAMRASRSRHPGHCGCMMPQRSR
jgi:hypothetical protein